MDFITIFTRLCNEKGVSPNKACNACGLSNSIYSYWKRNNAVPNDPTMERLAEYFGVTPEYLSGEDFREGSAARKAGLVVEWLEDNDYEYTEEENGEVSISKDGETIWLTNADFINECLAIHEVAKEGFELSMCDWVNRRFQKPTLNIDEYERGLIELLRELTPADKIKVIGQVVELCKGLEKNKTQRANSTNAG